MKNCHENRRQMYKIPNKELKLLIYKELLYIVTKKKNYYILKRKKNHTIGTWVKAMNKRNIIDQHTY